MSDIDKEKYMKQMSLEIHRRVVKKFKRRKVITNGPNDVWAIDLVDMSEWKDDNDGFPYMLNVIDAFTRYAWSIPLEDKSADTVTNAFKTILEDNGEAPKRLWGDQGKEFYNTKFKALLKKHKTQLYSTYGEFKASPVERYNRTHKTNMWKYFTEHNTRRWIDINDQITNDYNHRKHSVIKMTPYEATQLSPEQIQELRKKLYKNPYAGDKKIQKKKPKFKVGDVVRLSRQKGVFEKGYHPNWTHETYTISGIGKKYPFVYYVEDYNKEPVEGSFYEEELQKTKYPDVYLIEKVLKTRMKNGKKEIYVKWVGFSDKYNSWTLADDSFDV